MKINFSQTLLGFDGLPIKDNDGSEWTLQKACIGCLNVALPGDDSLAPAEKVALGSLAVSILKDEEINSEDAAKLKTRICRLWVAPVVAWSVDNAIEGRAS